MQRRFKAIHLLHHHYSELQWTKTLQNIQTLLLGTVDSIFCWQSQSQVAVLGEY